MTFDFVLFYKENISDSSRPLRHNSLWYDLKQKRQTKYERGYKMCTISDLGELYKVMLANELIIPTPCAR